MSMLIKWVWMAVISSKGVGCMMSLILFITLPPALSSMKNLIALKMVARTNSISNISGSLLLVHCQGAHNLSYFHAWRYINLRNYPKFQYEVLEMVSKVSIFISIGKAFPVPTSSYMKNFSLFSLLLPSRGKIFFHSFLFISVKKIIKYLLDIIIMI